MKTRTILGCRVGRVTPCAPLPKRSWTGRRARSAAPYLGLRLAMALVCTLSLGAPCSALEVDCQACYFCCGKKDLADELTERIRNHITQGRSAPEIAEAEGGKSIIRSPIELWAERHPKATAPDRRLIKYRGSNLPDNILFSAYARCIKVGGVCIGTDKLGHLFQQGWEYYQISVIDGKGDHLAERYGEWLEGKEPKECYSADEPYFLCQHSGRLAGYGGFGRTISGIISNADLAASRAGLRLYQDLSRGAFENITNYISGALCEEINLNEYTPEMKKIVERNGRR